MVQADAASFTFVFGTSALNPQIDVARIAGRVTGEGAAALQEQFTNAIGAATRFVIADLTGCLSCDLAGFSVFIGLDVTLRRRGGAFSIVGLNHELMSAYRLLGLHRVLSSEADEAAAVSSLAPLVRR
jgi:anti-anti-sigma regulatory factor